MDFQAFVDTCAMPCAVLSVEKVGADSYGEIRIVCANEVYKQTMGPAYYDGMLYYELVPKDLKFEDFCYRSAILKQHMHAYVETKALNCWTDQQMVPLKSDRDDMGFCQFLFEFTQKADPTRMASVSQETAEAVLKASITMLSAVDFREGIKEVQQDILRISEGYNCRIMLVDHKLQKATAFSEVFTDNRIPDNSLDGVLSYDLVSSWEAMIGDSNGVIVKNEREMEDLGRRNPAWVESLRKYKVTSLVLIPLHSRNSIFGWLHVVNYNVEKTVQVKELLELLSFILGSEISNYLLMNQLEEMGSVDALTGILNRNAMTRITDALDQNESRPSFGVINLDLNGLKTVNDLEGHDAGDRLLKDAAVVLRKVFRRGDLFRSGGDEFIVIAANIQKDLFDEKVVQLREEVQRHPRVSFAIGDYWSDGNEDVRTVFLNADKRMYEDKRAYYADHPEEARR